MTSEFYDKNLQIVTETGIFHGQFDGFKTDETGEIVEKDRFRYIKLSKNDKNGECMFFLDLISYVEPKELTKEEMIENAFERIDIMVDRYLNGEESESPEDWKYIKKMIENGDLKITELTSAFEEALENQIENI